MKKDLLLLQLKKYEEDYKKFMDIEEFPAYKLQTREVSLSLSDMRGFEVAASTHYLPQEKQHSLLISTNLRLIKYGDEYISYLKAYLLAHFLQLTDNM